MAAVDWVASYTPRQRSYRVSLLGMTAFAVARVADTVITAPLLLTHPQGEANPIARWLVASAGIEAYVLASLLAIPACILLIEGLVRVDWPAGTRGTWSECWVKFLAYGLLTVASAVAAIHNVALLADVLGRVFI